MTNEELKIIDVPYQKALALWKEKHFEEAISMLLEIAKEHPKFPPALAMIGAIYREMDDMENAVKYFEQTVKISPRSELASRGLFYSLLKLGYKDRAFLEIKRFLSVGKSDEYERILNEINMGLLEEPGNYLKISDEPTLN